LHIFAIDGFIKISDTSDTIIMTGKSENNIAIFYYHHIEKPGKNSRKKGLYVAPEYFEWQIKKIIQQGFEIITFEDIILNRFKKDSPHAILTFDDGCESLYQNAFPILKKFNIRAVIYIITGSIGDKNYISQENPNTDPVRLLSDSQINEMADFGIEFGSHLYEHIHLTKYSSERIKHELSSSKAILENLLNKKVYSVAYPFGDYDPQVLKSAKEAGYSFGVTTKAGIASIENKLELGRIPVKGYALRHYWYFWKKLRLALNQI
jgi:peptidoglycan/xylan/chitin deacetylase (PgdA/CDA1 family)